MCCFVRTDRRTDGQTDMTKLIVAFRNFGKAPEKISFTLLPAIKFQRGVPGVFTQKL